MATGPPAKAAFCVYNNMKNNSLTLFAAFVLFYIASYIYYQYTIVLELKEELIQQEAIISEQHSLIKTQKTYILLLEDMTLSPLHRSRPTYKLPI